MKNILYYLSLLVVILGTINLFRMSLFLIGSDIYNLYNFIKLKKRRFVKFPNISVVIPAYNEEKNIIACVESVFNCIYPKELLQVIVVNDGSKDATQSLLEKFKTRNAVLNLIIVNQENQGKATALNNGIKNYAKGELVMCLDSDSYLDKNALLNTIKYFKDTKVMAVASNVKIVPAKGLLNFLQKFEYLISYQMKRAQTLFNIEYIIGGIGSTFRRNFIKEIGFYDTNTVTEDIDITMKILGYGNKNVRVIYASDVISYTQAVLTFKDLIKQRFRWKWGRTQTFYKNKNMFFNSDKKFGKSLTWFYLPYAIFSDIAFILEPLVILYILILILIFRDYFTLIGAISVLGFYFAINVIAEDTVSIKEKIPLILISPFMYFLFYIMILVEYVSLIKAVIKLPHLKQSLAVNSYTWNPVKRK